MPADRDRNAPLAAARAALPVAAVVAFALAVDANPNTDGPLPAVVAVVLAGAGILAARRLPGNRSLAAVGAAVTTTAAWLLPQRDDLAASFVLAALAGLGTGLAVESPRPSRAAGAGAVGAIVLAGALRLTGSQDALVAFVALVAVAGAIATVAGTFPARRARRSRALAFGIVFVGTTVGFTAYVGAETPAATWFGGGAVHGPTGGNEVALTFDDGPNLRASLEIMRILDAHGVKGTFFEVGKAIDAAPQITRALYEDGQLLGNHSYHHDQWRWLDPRYPELARTQDAFSRAIGTCPVLYRPPHGDRTPFLAKVVRDRGMHMVLWSASAGDWATGDADRVAQRIVDAARPGSILLLHDGLDGDPSADRSVVVRALPRILDGLRAKGLDPVRLDRLLGTAAYEPC